MNKACDECNLYTRKSHGSFEFHNLFVDFGWEIIQDKKTKLLQKRKKIVNLEATKPCKTCQAKISTK